MHQTTSIEYALDVLHGLEFWGCGRAADLQWLQFGARYNASLRSGKPRQVGDYALHIQCAWRLCDHSAIIVASRDRYYPRSDAEPIDEAFNWDIPGGNRCDERMDGFLASHGPLRVVKIAADDVGGFKLSLNGGFVFEVFPDDSLGDEIWRLFRPSARTPHIVFEGGRIVEHAAA